MTKRDHELTNVLQGDQNNAAPVLVYLVTEDWYFLSHRLPMALAAQQAGYDVHVATRVGTDGDAIERFGFTLHPLTWKRGSANPVDVIASIREVRALYRNLKPDLAHHVGLQPSVIGSFAAARSPMAIVNALTGLGFSFTSGSVKARVLRPLMSLLLRILLQRPRAIALVQNPDDRTALMRLGIPADKIRMIFGSGVDVGALQPLLEPPGAITTAFVGRLLDDKGLRPLVAAHDLLARQGQPVMLLIAGDPDPANPASIPAAEIEGWRRMPHLKVLGHVEDIESVWAEAHIAVLPSRREGLPKSLLEAAAYGRPIVATDVPGCREIARHDLNAFLVPVDDPQPLAGAIATLARDPTLRQKFGQAGRRLVETEFSSERIGHEIVALYDGLLDRRKALLPAP